MKLLAYLLSYVPRRLPVGKTDYDRFVDRVIRQAGEFADRDSMAWAISTQVIHLAPQKSRISDQYFIRSLRKAAANQIASAVFQEVKERQQAAALAAQSAATQPQDSVPNEKPQAQG